MGTVTNVLLCIFVVVIAQAELILEADRPFLSVQQGRMAVLECCYTKTMEQKSFKWFKHVEVDSTVIGPHEVNLTDFLTVDTKNNKPFCGILNFLSVQPSDSGFYQCWLIESKVFTYGTYLHVFKPLGKAIDIKESTKNKILTAEGVLLFLCVILPAATLLFQSKRISELEKKKERKEEENIYQGLNLEDCCTTYDQIERSQAHGQYEDVCTPMQEEEEEIQLEKP
ncbi:B-cell antigen receptor complex-associated protein alpha chain [Notolabrus celidotus]|uniref:B-cell antigen receptor complex-associated protein alpha chain n=1 Tax=Notolabrus celidotus TaxID=1203425 RepID=UPI0014903AE0|nr:B-cell antigen receptor complex-associated protein alpha chain [Notolabrus celidotus]